MKIRLFGTIAAILLLAGILVPMSKPADACWPWHMPGIHPVVFVHGGSGSGAQFESQAMRFTSNFYPHEYIYVHEYDSSSIEDILPQVLAGLDELIAGIQDETGADQVDILGHSLGTTVMHAYLASPERAANVAHYVNIDGRIADAPPGGVPTLAIWAGRGTPGREIVGATNVTIPNQTHVQVATSAESFVEMYKFFTGHRPLTKYILPQFFGRIELAGRAVYFPQNEGVQDRTLEIWRVDGDTGERIRSKPEAVYSISGDGAWGPFKARRGAHYEMALVREGTFTHHFYFEPFIRSDYLIRLQTEEPGVGVGAYMDYSDHHSNVIVIRYKELWGDQGVENDTLEINGVDVVSPGTHPIDKRVIATFVFDKDADGVHNLGVPIFPFYLLHFLAGVDLYIPGVDPPDGTIPVVLTPRDGGGKTQVINIPNRASLDHRVTLQFNDYLQPWPWW
jgi:pimeloyl-ACP methyl ester carboxylesterase